ncbi:uncharacterized protein LOC131048452 isoform X2 [Cryptomeria japonica]|uniref:uncharacterized protein LOC131048452 isoform X2 n=1 Tax=Cryptomeria japonica TaxID=3369 RepID=UPI0027DA6902|nr:uncharacterized protein LOC131048452 isoform X2 [Cryptomeria japonica]
MKKSKGKESAPNVEIRINSMEKKNNATAEGQLDFNAPLMSVRRISGSPTENEKVDSKVNGGSDSSSKSILPVYRSDLKSGPLRDPGTVPFVWEQTPGRPKDEQKVKANYNCPSPRAPRLPPGRILSAKQANIETPEPPKVKSDNEQRNGLPSKHTNRASSKISANSNDTLASRRLGQSKPCVPEDDLDSEGCDDFSDAVETLSQTESSAVAYCVSMVSGMEGYDLRSTGRSVDPQTRNFMMDRFLPAAKAMASESPQQSSRRVPTKPITSGRESRGPSPLQSRPYPRKHQSKEKEPDDIAVFSSKACGLFPRRLRSAFSNSSPITQLSRMKKKHFSLSPALNRRNSRGNLSDGDPLSDSDGETWEALYRQKLENGSKSTCYLRKGNETRAFSASASPDMGIMSRISCGSDSQTFNKFGTPTSGGISPYRNEPFRSPFSEGTGFLGFPKADKEDSMPGVESRRMSCNSLNDMGPEEDLCFWKSPPLLGNTTRAGSVSPTIEKTVYVDYVHKTRSPVVKPGYLNHNELVKGSESDFDVRVPDTQNKPKHDVSDSYLVDSMKMLEVANVSDSLKSKKLDQSPSVVADQPYCSDQTVCVSNESDNKEQSIVLVGKIQDIQVKEGWPLGIANKCKEVSDEKKALVPVNVKPESTVSVTGLAPPLQPPLPKSPSESWLWRAMPRTPSPNSPSQRYSRLGSPLRKQQQGSKASIADPKWETIVKSAYTQPGHLRFSEEFNYKATPGSFRREGS